MSHCIMYLFSILVVVAVVGMSKTNCRLKPRGQIHCAFA